MKPAEMKKGHKWKREQATYKQTEDYLVPLFNQLQNETVASDILDFLTNIICLVLERNYVQVCKNLNIVF